MAAGRPRTLFDKIWESHLVHRQDDGTCLLYIDRHLVHEVTSPQAFEGLRLAGRKVRRPEATLAVADHNVPTTDRSARHRGAGIARSRSRRWRRTAREFGIALFLHGRYPPGHRPHHRAGAGPDPARHDHRLRRQPHRDPWRLRGAGLRHRHLRGRACAGDADPDPAAGQEHAGHASRAICPSASPPRTWSSPSSARSAPPAAPAMSSNMPARRSATSRWKGA